MKPLLQGGMHGIAYSVAADAGYSEYQFRVVDGQVFHKMSSGASVFLGIVTQIPVW